MTRDSDKYDDPEVEAQWIAEQRETVEDYLQREECHHRGVSREPVWHVAPYVAIWTVESLRSPGATGWWAISGDVPTDYLSAHDAHDARSAMAAFADRWHSDSGHMLRGQEPPETHIGPPEQTKELGDLLRRRAQTLKEWAEDDDFWG